MEIDIRAARDIGAAVRAVRKAQRLRQDDAAGRIGVSESFLGKVENGAESIHWGKLFQVLEGLGVLSSSTYPTALASSSREQTSQYARAARAEKRRRERERDDDA